MKLQDALTAVADRIIPESEWWAGWREYLVIVEAAKNHVNIPDEPVSVVEDVLLLRYFPHGSDPFAYEVAEEILTALGITEEE
jgi:hypothetical protein